MTDKSPHSPHAVKEGSVEHTFKGLRLQRLLRLSTAGEGEGGREGGSGGGMEGEREGERVRERKQ